MARSLEQHLAILGTLTFPAGLDQLRAALAVRTPRGGVVIAAAAKLVAEHRLDHLVPELGEAFAALAGADRVQKDPQCRGKVAIAKALHELDHWDDGVFVRGLSIEQREGWSQVGPPDDTAAELRGICGLAHAHFARHDALDVLAELLADAERVTRLAAAQALGDSGHVDATALLRFKLLTVEHEEPEVLSACFESLLALGRSTGEAFAIRMLAAHDDRAEAAALALGGARIASALPALVAWCESCLAEQRHRVGYLAIALLRCDDGNRYLLDAVGEAKRGDAIAAATALATFKEDATVAARLREAAAAVRDKAIRREIEQLLAE
ncbi:MAG TPA: hypothetical protein VFQ53_30470 [Kofleriaceae bacterium]|nr:hypothetical protein [Kofleriaceae bacterium]